jgi:ankyrin repeat protein
MAGDSANSEGQGTALHLAAKKGCEEEVRKLLEDGRGNVDKTDMDGMVPLDWAAKMGHRPVVELLLCSKAVVNKEDKHKRTALLWAAEKNHIEVVDLLLKYNAHVGSKDDFERSALLWAVENKNKGMVKLHTEPENIAVRIRVEWAGHRHHNVILAQGMLSRFVTDLKGYRRTLLRTLSF